MMYSRQLMQQRVENFCAKCETKFPQWSLYHAHVVLAKCQRQIKPFNTSGRSKTQIVSDWESQQKEGAIIR